MKYFRTLFFFTVLGAQLALSADTCGFEAEITALYLLPSGSNLHFAAEADPVTESEPLPAQTPNWKIHNIRPDYHWGFAVGLNAHDFCRCAKAHADYAHLRANDTSSTTVPSENMLGPFFEIGPDASAFTYAKGKVAFEYDAFNINYGAIFCESPYFLANFFAGVGGVRIEEKITSFFSNEEEDVTRTIKTPSTFLGAGPQLGLDFSYIFCEGLQLTGRAVGTLYVGKVKNHTDYTSVFPTEDGTDILTSPNKQSTHTHKRTQVVPGFEGKLGLSYGFDLCNCAITAEAGYEVRYYFNAIQTYDIGSEVDTPPIIPGVVGVYARTFQRNISDFSLAGPYVRLSMDF